MYEIPKNYIAYFSIIILFYFISQRFSTIM